MVVQDSILYFIIYELSIDHLYDFVPVNVKFYFSQKFEKEFSRSSINIPSCECKSNDVEREIIKIAWELEQTTMLELM